MNENRKIRVGILFGGKSAEHEVSLQSAKNVVDAIDTEKYEVSLIGIDKSGKWLLPHKAEFLLHANDPKLISLNKTDEEDVALVPESGGELTSLSHQRSPFSVDVIFPILHGPFGEDGTVQGLLKLADVPFVGAGVLGSAVGMDKDVMKRLLRDAGIPIARFLVLTPENPVSFEEAKEQLGMPLFVKPANLGSSVGVSKVKNAEDFQRALENAFQYDNKILIEECIEGRELECGVLGNQDARASEVGEIIPQHEFYSYEAKYIDENGAITEVPARIDPEVAERIQTLAL